MELTLQFKPARWGQMPELLRTQPAGWGTVWPRKVDETALIHCTRYFLTSQWSRQIRQENENSTTGVGWEILTSCQLWTAGQFSSEAQRKETQRALDLGLWGWREGRGGCSQGSSAGRLVPPTPIGTIQLGTRWLLSEADGEKEVVGTCQQALKAAVPSVL